MEILGCPSIGKGKVFYRNTGESCSTPYRKEVKKKGCKFESPPIGEVKNFFISDSAMVITNSR